MHEKWAYGFSSTLRAISGMEEIINDAGERRGLSLIFRVGI
jgi:hypothetical protein